MALNSWKSAWRPLVRAGGVLVLVSAPTALIVGRSWARCTRYCARALSMLPTATRRSRFWVRAWAITACSRGSVKTSRQARSPAVGSAGVAATAAATGHAGLTGRPGRA